MGCDTRPSRESWYDIKINRFKEGIEAKCSVDMRLDFVKKNM